MGRKLSHIYTPYSILFLVAITILSLLLEQPTQAQEIISSSLTPVKVIDGDSLEIGSHRIRLIGIDAPEYHQLCKNKKRKNYPCGKESLSYLQKIISHHEVKCIIHQKDKYNRDLCTCYADGKDLNAEMIRSGHAIIYMESNYAAEQEEAKQHKRGIWNGKFIHPRLYRRLQEQQKSK